MSLCQRMSQLWTRLHKAKGNRTRQIYTHLVGVCVYIYTHIIHFLERKLFLYLQEGCEAWVGGGSWALTRNRLTGEKIVSSSKICFPEASVHTAFLATAQMLFKLTIIISAPLRWANSFSL